MLELGDAIKLAAMNAFDASKPAEPVIGTVSTANPLMINLDSKVPLSKKSLILMKGLDLETGDKVLLIRASGGQKFYVIGEVEQ